MAPQGFAPAIIAPGAEEYLPGGDYRQPHMIFAQRIIMKEMGSRGGEAILSRMRIQRAL